MVAAFFCWLLTLFFLKRINKKFQLLFPSVSNGCLVYMLKPNGVQSNLCSLHHLLIQVIREGPHSAELPRALSAREHLILVDQAAATDGDQGDAVAAEALVQVDVASLDLAVYGDDPEENTGARSAEDKSLAGSRSTLKGWIGFHTWIPRGPRPPRQRLHPG